MRKKIVSFLASGRGSNFTVVANHILNGNIPGKLGILVSDQAGAKALDIARDFGMKSFHVSPKNYPSRMAHEEEISRLLDEAGTDLIVAAGYMRILSSYFVNRYKHRIINIHPALLPSFPGVHAQQQAFDYGVKITGCTAHFIDEGTDTGPIIMQAYVPVLGTDTEDRLAARILKEEHRILPESVRLFCEGKLTVKGRKVYIQD
ncbi:MAG TPA: phosphoribosylglycinamide formyltransferase [Spirochaetota bacterium]|nr:phosphoribosylglycinamide formyltransferase [Spirochaetota bacterium]HPI87753.1 phosphoribosylglycinamide formyltransferase [Spirochaetota bacterium]HPR48122.1 phosphoribosylglycinamide formyltransferase [Spirochaetota bacterium]